MGKHENVEAPKAADQIKEDKSGNLTAYVMERPMANCQNGRDKSSDLVNQGVLPAFDLLEADTRKGPIAKPENFKQAGVKVETAANGDKEVTYPSGVEITSGKSKSEHCNMRIESQGLMITVKEPNHFNKDGSQILDAKGRVIGQQNEDNSWTIDSGEGFFTQHEDGTIERNSAIRSRDGKTFEVLDTETPLGNLRPGDMTKHK